MKAIIRRVAWIPVVLVLALTPGCGGSDSGREILKTRRLWKVDLAGFVQRDDGVVSAQFRLSGPAGSKLDVLTVKIDLLDAEDRVLSGNWKSFDLREVRRGGPVEQFITIESPGAGVVVESIRLDPVHYPEPADYAHIPELHGMAPPAE